VKNKLRIIGGDWRSRQLSFVDAPGLRPTPARVRETLFNWLQYGIFGKQCLDLYAGSGALGFEAASRGAKSVIQVENNVQACRCLKDNALTLSAADRIKVVQSDVLRYLAGDAQAFDVVFLDPPFGLTNPPGADLHLPEGRRAGQPCVTNPPGADLHLPEGRRAGQPCVTNPPGADLHLPEGRRAGQPCVNLAIQTCRLLEENGWLAKHAKIYVETERHFDFSCRTFLPGTLRVNASSLPANLSRGASMPRILSGGSAMQIGNPADLSGMPENWRQLKSKSAGEVGYHLFERIE